MKPLKLRSSNDNSDLYELVDFPINIIVRESNSSARYLTHQGLNKEIVLKNYDANNNVYHTFYLKRVPLTGELYIEVPVPPQSFFQTIANSAFNLPAERKLVSAGVYTNNPNVTVLYVKDGTSSIGSCWDIYPSQRNIGGNGAYIFYNSDLFGGGANFFDVYNLCLQSENANLRFGKYSMQGTQEFEIRPIEEFDMASLELFVDNSSFAVKKPDFYQSVDYNNNTDADQDLTVTYSKKATYTSSFTRKNSISLSISTTLKVGAPVFLNGQITASASSTNEWTYGQTEQKEDTRTYNFPIRINKRTRVVATIYVAQYEMNLKYKAVFRGKTTGKYFTEIGDWKGVDCADIKVDVQATNVFGNTQTLTFNGVPTSRVIFSPSGFITPNSSNIPSTLIKDLDLSPIMINSASFH